MKALIEFISTYVPDYANIVRGAPADQIARLEAILGSRVPLAYRDFLETAAANLGFDTPEIDFDVERVIELAAAHDKPDPNRFILIAQDEGPGFEDYFLDLCHPQGNEDALIIRTATGAESVNEPRPMFLSLRDMLFSLAFEKIRMLPMQYRLRIFWLPGASSATKPPTLDKLSAVMSQLNFRALNLTSPSSQLYERGDSAAIVYQIPFQPYFTLLVSALERREAISIAETVRDALPQNVKVSDSSH